MNILFIYINFLKSWFERERDIMWERYSDLFLSVWALTRDWIHNQLSHPARTILFIYLSQFWTILYNSLLTSLFCHASNNIKINCVNGNHVHTLVFSAHCAQVLLLLFSWWTQFWPNGVALYQISSNLGSCCWGWPGSFCLVWSSPESALPSGTPATFYNQLEPRINWLVCLFCLCGHHFSVLGVG